MFVLYRCYSRRGVRAYSIPPISLYCTDVIPVEERGIVPPRSVGIAPPPSFFVGGPGCDWGCVLSLHVAGHPEESITFLRLVVVASSRLPLVLVGVSLISVLSINFIPLTVGIVEGRSFSDLCLFLCSLTLCQLRALHKGTGHASRLERAPPRRHSRVNRVTPRSLKIHSLPLPVLL